MPVKAWGASNHETLCISKLQCNTDSDTPRSHAHKSLEKMGWENARHPIIWEVSSVWL